MVRGPVTSISVGRAQTGPRTNEQNEGAAGPGKPGDLHEIDVRGPDHPQNDGRAPCRRTPVEDGRDDAAGRFAVRCRGSWERIVHPRICGGLERFVGDPGLVETIWPATTRSPWLLHRLGVAAGHNHHPMPLLRDAAERGTPARRPAALGPQEMSLSRYCRAMARGKNHSLPLLTYIAPGGLRQAPGRAENRRSRPGPAETGVARPVRRCRRTGRARTSNRRPVLALRLRSLHRCSQLPIN